MNFNGVSNTDDSESKIQVLDLETENYASLNDELQKIDNFGESTATSTNLNGILFSDEIATTRLYDITKSTSINLDDTDISVTATTFKVNGDNLPDQISALETKCQNIIAQPPNSALTKIIAQLEVPQINTSRITDTSKSTFIDIDSEKVNIVGLLTVNGDNLPNLISTNTNDISTINGKVGQNLGIATLDGAGKLPIAQLPLNTVIYCGTWNASTNTPTITSGVAPMHGVGCYSVVNVPGSIDVDGVTDWKIGDWIIWNGTIWQKVDHTDQVTTVNDLQGSVVLNMETLNNVDITSVSPNEVLKYNGVKWVNNTLAEANIATQSNLGAVETKTQNITHTLNSAVTQVAAQLQAPQINTSSVKDLSQTTSINLDSEKVSIVGGLTCDIATANQLITNLITAPGSPPVVIGGSDSKMTVNNRNIKIECGVSVSVDSLFLIIDADILPSTTASLGTVAKPWNVAHITTLKVDDVDVGDSLNSLADKTVSQSINVNTYAFTQSFGYMTSDTSPSPYVASTSSQLNDLAAYKAFDGNNSTFWHSSYSGGNYNGFNNTYNKSNGKNGISKKGDWIVLDMNTTYFVQSVKLRSAPDRTDEVPTAYSIIYSNDGNTYDTAIYSTQEINDIGFTLILPIITQCRYIGIQIHSSSHSKKATLGSFEINVLIPKTKFVGEIECDTLKLNSDKIAIGLDAGNGNQKQNSVAIGNASAQFSQEPNSIAIGNACAQFGQGSNSIAIGTQAGKTSQGAKNIAIGFESGIINQKGSSVAIGDGAGRISQNIRGVAIGNLAGRSNQGVSSVAIGTLAGSDAQGGNSIALGNSAGVNNQHLKTTIINATGEVLDSKQSDSLFIKPIRPASNTYFLKYNIGTGEITYEA